MPDVKQEVERLLAKPYSPVEAAVYPLIAEMTAKLAMAEAKGDELTITLCTQVLQNVVPMVTDRPSPVPAIGKAALIGAWSKHRAA